MQQILWEVIFKARPFPYKDDWVVIVECNMLFTFYRVHKYLYIHLQLRKPVPKADSKLSFARHVFIQCIDFGREKANLNAIQKQFISVRLWQGRPRVSFVASSPLTAHRLRKAPPPPPPPPIFPANGRIIVGQQLLPLLDSTSCVRLHTLLPVVACCCELWRKVWSRSNF